MRPFTYSIAKQLLPVANKPVLHYCMDFLVSADIKEIGVIVGDTHRQIKTSLADGSRWGAEITYIHQDQPKGLAHAVLLAEEFIGDSPFVMVLGDNLIEEDLKHLIKLFNPIEHSVAVVLREVDNPKQFGVAKVSGNKIVYLVEKPSKPPSNLAIMGIYLFTRNIFDTIKFIKPSARGELEITDAIQSLIKSGSNKVIPLMATGQWYDVGCPEDLLKANALQLKKKEVDSNIEIPASSKLINTCIEAPSIVGEHCIIKDSYIGPYTSIGDGCNIVNCSISNTIIFNYCTLNNSPWHIKDSVIAENFSLAGPPGKELKIIAGSDCVLDFSTKIDYTNYID